MNGHTNQLNTINPNNLDMQDQILYLLSKYMYVSLQQLNDIMPTSLRTVQRNLDKLIQGKKIHKHKFHIGDSTSNVYTIARKGIDHLITFYNLDSTSRAITNIPNHISHHLASRDFIYHLFTVDKMLLKDVQFEVKLMDYSKMLDKPKVIADAVIEYGSKKLWLEADLGNEDLNGLIRKSKHIERFLTNENYKVVDKTTHQIIFYLPISRLYYRKVERRILKRNLAKLKADLRAKKNELKNNSSNDKIKVLNQLLEEANDNSTSQGSELTSSISMEIEKCHHQKNLLKHEVKRLSQEFEEASHHYKTVVMQASYDQRRRTVCKAFFEDWSKKSEFLKDSHNFMLVSDSDQEDYTSTYLFGKGTYRDILPSIFASFCNNQNQYTYHYHEDLLQYFGLPTPQNLLLKYGHEGRLPILGTKYSDRVYFIIDGYFNLTNILRTISMLKQQVERHDNYYFLVVVHTEEELSAIKKHNYTANMTGLLYGDLQSSLKDFHQHRRANITFHDLRRNI